MVYYLLVCDRTEAKIEKVKSFLLTASLQDILSSLQVHKSSEGQNNLFKHYPFPNSAFEKINKIIRLVTHASLLQNPSGYEMFATFYLHTKQRWAIHMKILFAPKSNSKGTKSCSTFSFLGICLRKMAGVIGPQLPKFDLAYQKNYTRTQKV